MGKLKLVDFSHPFGQDTPLWPSGGDVHIDRINDMPMHHPLPLHNSTPAGSPSHVIPGREYPWSVY